MHIFVIIILSLAFNQTFISTIVSCSVSKTCHNTKFIATNMKDILCLKKIVSTNFTYRIVSILLQQNNIVSIFHKTSHIGLTKHNVAKNIVNI